MSNTAKIKKKFWGGDVQIQQNKNKTLTEEPVKIKKLIEKENVKIQENKKLWRRRRTTNPAKIKKKLLRRRGCQTQQKETVYTACIIPQKRIKTSQIVFFSKLHFDESGGNWTSRQETGERFPVEISLQS